MPRVRSVANAGFSKQAAARQAAPTWAGLQAPAGPANPDRPEPADGGTGADYGELFQSYQDALGMLGDVDCAGQDAAALERIKDHLGAQQAGASVCLVCLEAIDRADATWHCAASCFAVLHLQCSQSWAQQQLTSARSRREEKQRLFPYFEPSVPIVWGCPKCRYEYGPEEVPRTYRCFCGKVPDPEVDAWKAPHSCGELCGRQLRSGCGHECVLLCHPGPCPPCPREVDATCYCGKAARRARCGRHLFSCAATCGKVLPCGHACAEECHEGDCPPCGLEAEHPCECGAETRRAPCSGRRWTCGRVCGAALDCGRHACQQGCHAGACGPCELVGARRCPCGKAEFTSLACDEPTPTCGETCGRLLPCGIHACAERCHAGPCPDTCRAMVSKACGCGKTHKTVPCFSAVRCDKRCPLLRACGRHACKRRCCDGDCPPCPDVCGRRLKCGNHKCPAPCHTGACLPCPLTATISCACGGTRFAVPCGAEGRAAPPRCHLPCRVPRSCRHAGSIAPHPCHFGPCPPCPSGGCGSALPCGHTCASAACHDPPPPPVPPYAPPPPPAAPSAGGASGSPPLAAPVQLVLQQLAEPGAQEGLKPSACPPYVKNPICP
eukprot:jgi/Tetstr1/446777/TSEL_034264.t1